MQFDCAYLPHSSIRFSSFGRGQMILRMTNGVYIGGSESRTDSNIACY